MVNINYVCVIDIWFRDNFRQRGETKSSCKFHTATVFDVINNIQYSVTCSGPHFKTTDYMVFDNL